MAARFFTLLLVALAALCALPAAGAAKGQQLDPWQAGMEVRDQLFEAQTALVLDEEGRAPVEVRRALHAFNSGLAQGLNRSSEREVRHWLNLANRAAEFGNATALAQARGRAWAAILAGAAAQAISTARAGDAAEAKHWLLLRDFRTSTKFTRPGTDATTALAELRKGELSGPQAALALRKDLLDTYQARMRDLLSDGDAAAERGFTAKAVEAAAQATGYWQILRPRFKQDFGATALRRADARFVDWQRAAETGKKGVVAPARKSVEQTVDGFVAAPFATEEEARRAQQLLRFLDLVPFEYKKGVKQGRVTKAFEVQEGIGFRNGAEQAFNDLRVKLQKRDSQVTAATAVALAQLKRMLEDAQQNRAVVSPPELARLADGTAAKLKAAFPPAWNKKTDASDFDLIALTLDRMEQAIAQGQWHAAEQARLEAYAFLEFGPELKLRAFDPNLAFEIEGFIWFGARGQPGLAQLIADQSTLRQVRPTRIALDESLSDAQATLGDGQSKTTAIVNSSILVFREGLEAVLILAAITASMVGVLARRRRAVMIGAAFGLVASIVTWGIAQLVLDSLSQYGEKLEAVVGLIAIVVLLYVMNWFFHKVYWTQHIQKFHQRRKKLVGEEDGDARVAFWSAQSIGFVLLGLTSVYREGFETVLFMQSLQLATDTVTVVLGALLGLLLTGGVAVITFKLQRKLPYKRMLIATGVMLALVLFVLVGNTVRSLQGVGWVSVTPIDIEVPYVLGTWLGVFPTWETLGAQIVAMVLVFGSYFLAEEIRVKRPRRRAARELAAERAEGATPREQPADAIGVPTAAEAFSPAHARDREPVVF